MSDILGSLVSLDFLNKKSIDSKKNFGFKVKFEIYSLIDDHDLIPECDNAYIFDEQTTTAILGVFGKNKKLIIQGYHGTGKSSHIEQVASRLKWPCVRINLDSNISRLDLIGRDTISVVDGMQVTKFQDGLLTSAVKNGFAVILDEYDAGRPDLMFVIQRLLENNGKLTLLETNEVITPHENFRLFATANTIGLGDEMGIYHGTNMINQAQLDRWDMVVSLNYLHSSFERSLIRKKIPEFKDMKLLDQMIQFTNLIRDSFINGDLSTVISIRTILSWIHNLDIFPDAKTALFVSFLNRCDKNELPLIQEIYQRVFDEELYS